MDNVYTPKRSYSLNRRTTKILDEPENGAYIAYEHPLHTYKKYLTHFHDDF